MRLICVSRFRGEHNGEIFDLQPDQSIHVTEDVAAHLLHRSPASFKVPTPPKEHRPKPEPAEQAMSTETATGLTVPDRRARGGKRRKR